MDGLPRRTLLAAALAGVCPPALAQSRLCLVSVQLNGRPARLILDTGAARTILTAAAVKRLGLPLDLWVDTLLRGAGGRLERHRNADVAAASLGGVPLYQTAPGAPLSLAVTERQMGPADGLLGGDILKHFTLRLAAGQVTLGHGAPGGLALTPLWPDQLLAPVLLDGQRLTALVDTGATASLLNARGLYRMGLTAGRATASTMAIGGRLAVRPHQFRDLILGDLKIPSPTLLTAAVPDMAFDMILGLDVLGARPLTISYPGLTLGFG